jgi:hypothetical protein
MKNYRTILKYAGEAIFAILLVLLFSCEKEKPCFKCTVTFDITQHYQGETSTWSTSDTQEFCDMTEDEKIEYELRNTNTTTDESSGVTTVTKMTTKCIK